ncbi:MAG: hypothetical protein PWP54_1006 [Thermosipho sp. (in: thermotogales)]|nr:hypothetical protein [Thermosipho sp. (in: thermotogales)]MDN5325085.1 hypothetical protein [Thermosipho sp. (in: thermotogales)]
MRKNISGVIAPIITPFDNNGKVDEYTFKNLIDFLSNKVHGLFVCGTYGSGPAMSINDRKKVTELVVKHVNGRIPIIVHVGASSLDDVIELSLHAQDSGAQAVSSVPPFYYKYTQDEIIRFFEKLASKIDIPVFIYNNPRTTGLSIEIETLKILKKMEMTGIKDSTYDLSYFYRIKTEVGFDDFIYISGSEAFILPTVSMGASGVISGLANVFPEIVVELYNYAKNNDFKKAIPLQEKVNALRQVQHMARSILSIHILLKLRGISSGYPKYPLILEDNKSLEEKMKNEIIRLGFGKFLL